MSDTTPRWRKTKSGDWVVFGPAAVVRPGAVEVAKKDGATTTEIVISVGRSFDVDGVACCYGYVAARNGDSARLCDNCGRRPGVMRASDMSGIEGWVCSSCGLTRYDLSFA